MARARFGGGVSDQVLSRVLLGSRVVFGEPTDVNGSPTAVTLTVWDEPDGTQITDLLDADLAPITEVLVPAGGQIPEFYGPNAVTELYLKDLEGAYYLFTTGPAGPMGSGDFDGPSSATDGHVVLFDGSSGKLGKDGGTVVSQVPAASTTVQGKVRLATSDETLVGDAADSAVTPAGAAATYQPLGDYQPEGDYQPLDLVSRLTAAATSTSTSYAASGLSVAVVAGGVYRIRIQGTYQSAATTTGLGLRLNGTATATALRAWSTIWGAATGVSTPQKAQLTALAGAHLTTSAAAINTDYEFEIEGLIRVNNAGTLLLEFASEVAASQVTLQADSFMVATRVA